MENTPLELARIKYGFKVKDMASQVGTDPGNMSRILHGQAPGLELAPKIVNLFPAGELTELHLFYPERYQESEATAAGDASSDESPSKTELAA